MPPEPAGGLPPLLVVQKSRQLTAPLCPLRKIDYTITVSNLSDQPGDFQASISDPLPEETGLLGTEIAGGGSFDPDTRSVVWSGPLAVGASHTIGFSVLVADAVEDGDEIVNRAFATLTHLQTGATTETLDQTADEVDCPPGTPPLLELEVVEIEGVVDCKSSDEEEWIECQEGQSLALGATISTGFDGFAKLVFLVEGEVAWEYEIEALSTIDVDFRTLTDEPVRMEVDVDFGEIKLDVKKETLEADAKISAPNHVTAIRGTRLGIVSDGTVDQTELEEGSIEVELPGSMDAFAYEVPEGSRDSLIVTTDGETILGECLSPAEQCAVLEIPGVGGVERVSVDSAGHQAARGGGRSSISGDGRWVAFQSFSSDLVPGDASPAADIFAHDRETGVTEQVNRDSFSNPGNVNSSSPAISADGRFVAFQSQDTNLVPGDTNDSVDVFVRDRLLGATERVSVDSHGTQSNGNSFARAAINADGRFVAFGSLASNLVAGDANGTHDVFVHDRETGVTTRVSVTSQGEQGDDVSRDPAISADGRFVAFTSIASNLVEADVAGTADVFVHDRSTGTTELVSVDSAGNPGNGASDLPSLSADGRLVAFESSASNLVPDDTNGTRDVFVHDRETGITERVSVHTAGTQGNGSSGAPSLDGEGRFVVFRSEADNLFPGDGNETGDILLHDRRTGVTLRLSMADETSGADASSAFPEISADGQLVTFISLAENLVPGDDNRALDTFVVSNPIDLTTLRIWRLHGLKPETKDETTPALP